MGRQVARLLRQISIHALLAESDRFMGASYGRTAISIHALLAESDQGYAGGHRLHRHFYPRSPCGERQGCADLVGAGRDISIHALLAESDTCSASRYLSIPSYFYPRSPCGERHGLWTPSSDSIVISIHALLAESDAGSMLLCTVHLDISIHALLAESDSKSAQNSGALLRI